MGAECDLEAERKKTGFCLSMSMRVLSCSLAVVARVLQRKRAWSDVEKFGLEKLICYRYRAVCCIVVAGYPLHVVLKWSISLSH